jgi:hypothetical protein
MLSLSATFKKVFTKGVSEKINERDVNMSQSSYSYGKPYFYGIQLGFAYFFK